MHSVAGCWPCASQASRQPGADLIAAECLRKMSSPSGSLPSLNRKRENRRNMSGGRRPTPKDLAENGSRALRVDDAEQVALGILENHEVFDVDHDRPDSYRAVLHVPETRESGDKLSSVPRHRDHVVGRDESAGTQVPNPETGNFMPGRRRGADDVQPEEHRLGAPEVREVRLRQA